MNKGDRRRRRENSAAHNNGGLDLSRPARRGRWWTRPQVVDDNGKRPMRILAKKIDPVYY